LAVEARGVRKSFGDQVVLDGIDLDVIEGTVFALLGPNGSGKTTTVRILSTLLAADAGVVRVAGHDVGREPDSVRAAIGVTGQFSAVDKLLTGRENLMMMADLAHLSRADGRRRAAGLLDRFDLVVPLHRPEPGELLSSAAGESSAAVAERVGRARQVARDRGVACNAVLPSAELDRLAPLTREAAALLDRHVRTGTLSGRGLHRVRRVARTIADLYGAWSPSVDAAHVAEALVLRVGSAVG